MTWKVKAYRDLSERFFSDLWTTYTRARNEEQDVLSGRDVEEAWRRCKTYPADNDQRTSFRRLAHELTQIPPFLLLLALDLLQALHRLEPRPASR
jgi:hypothetical protein